MELARTATLVPDLEKKITLKQNEIAFLAGEYPHDIKRTVLPEDVIHAASLPVGLPSSLLERRPDVRQAEQAVIAANAAVGIAYTNMFPKLTLTAMVQKTTNFLICSNCLITYWRELFFSPFSPWEKTGPC